MIREKIVDNTLYVTLVVALADVVQEILVGVDTGFDGDLKLPEEKAAELDLAISHIERVRLADGRKVDMQASFVYVEMEGVMNSANVLVAKGHPVIGVGLLKKFDYTLIADFKRNVLALDAKKKWIS